MPEGLAVWLIGAAVWGFWTVFRIPGAVRSLPMISLAFWTGLMWPLYVPVMIIATLLKA
jgi:hypothetical protein